MRKTFNIPKDYEDHNRYFKKKYSKAVYDSMICELLEIKRTAMENNIDMKLLIETIDRYNIDMIELLSIIYDNFKENSTDDVERNIHKKNKRTESNSKDAEINEDEDFGGLAIEGINFSSEEDI